jgi:hypothetical protein
MPGRSDGEMHWFDKHSKWKRGLEAYSKKFKRAKEQGKIVGEKTPVYVRERKFLKRIKDATPDAKLVIMLRDPTDRWFSHHNHRGGMKRKTNQQFFDTNKDAIKRGMYYEQLVNVFDLFPAENVFVEFTERLRNHTRERVGKILDFLGVDRRKQWRVRKRSSNWKNSDEWRQKINKVYRPMLIDLRALLKEKGFDYAPIDDWCKD